MISQIRSVLSVTFLIVLLVGSGLIFGGQPAAAADGEELDLSRIELPEKGNPKLDSRLNQLVSANITRKVESFAQEHNIEMVDDNVRVIIECLPDEVDAAVKAADDLGIVETSYRNLLQVVVPVSQLTTLADKPSVRLVRLPWEPVATANISEGVALINADDWHTASYNGTGVKVAILDGGFSGYTTRQSEGELPSTVTTWWAPSIGNAGTSVHGTACAEIVYDIAPDADFYLANFGTIVEQGNAVDWLITQGVDVISCSMGWTVGGPGDGTGTACEIVDDAHAAGILWSQSAGNYAESHWQGDFADSDDDDIHDFAAGPDETIDISVSSGYAIRVELKWNDTWGSSGNDYNLYLFDASLTTPVDYSDYPQDGDDDPWEYISYTATYTGTYHIVIDGYYASQTKNLEIFCYSHDLQEYQVASHSLIIPADSGNAMSLGAVDYSTPTTLESFSSQGPTTDNRIKPDLVATDNVSTATYGTGFFGTSASAPHAAGAAALVKERYPSYTNDAIQTFLEGRAVDLGDYGKDNLFGSGRLDLGSPPETTPPTMEAIVETEGQYYNVAPVLSNFGFDDNEALDDGWYQMDSYAGSWTTLFTDNGTASWDNDGWTIPGFDGLSEGSHTIYFKASDEADNVEGESGEWGWQFYKDTTPPTMEAIAETEGQYYNVAPVLSNFGFDDDALDDGSYQMDSFAGSWTVMFTDVFTTDVSNLAIASDNTTIYATDRQRDKIYRSTDAGVNWMELTNPTGATEPQLIAVTPDDADFVVIVADDNEVYVSDDAFTTWDTLDLELTDATITVQDLDISVALGGNHFVAVVGDNGTDAKVYYYEVGAIGSKWEDPTGNGGFASDQDEAGAVVFSPNFASDEVMVTVTANLSHAINFQAFSFNTETWNDQIGGFSSDYPVAIASDDGITGLTSASISLAPAYLGTDNTTRTSFIGLTVAGDADAVATSGIYRLDDTDLKALKTGEQIHSIAYNGTNLVAGEYDTTIVWRSADPLATTPTVSSSLSSPGGDDKVVVTWVGSDAVAGTSGNESAFAVSTDNGENFTDTSLDGTSWDSDNWTIPGFGSLSEDSHTIYFNASDNASNVEGESGEWNWQFFATDLPVLRDGAVSPTSGYTSATFTYSVTYADAEDDAPNPITVSINGGASENMTVKAGQDSDYTNGEIYEYSISGANLGVGTHTFQFAASDGTDNATGDIGSHSGPTVSSPPKVGGGGGGGGGGMPGWTTVGGEHTAKGKFDWDVTCESEDKCVELFIPEGTIGKGPKDTFLRVIKILEAEVLPPIPEHTNYIGLVYKFLYEGTTFDPPVDLTIRYDESLIPEGIDENSLIIATWDKYVGEWIGLESTVDTEKNTVTIKIDHFTKLTILAHTRPANFTVTNLSVTPKEIDIGESVSISILITNTGDLTGSYEVCLRIDNIAEQTKEVTLIGNSSQEVTFSVTRDIAGTCSVDINGLIGSFIVKEEAPLVAEEEIVPTPAPATALTPTVVLPVKPPINWPLIGGIIAVCVVVAGLLTYFFVWRKRGALRPS